jgi:predicted Rossmann-fold nucleotide-binding protein
LPGGIGTLEEPVEISTWAQLDQHAKPIIICNIDNYWSPLITLIEHMRAEKFIREGIELKLDVVNAAEDILPTFLERAAKTKGKVPVEPMRKTM